MNRSTRATLAFVAAGLLVAVVMTVLVAPRASTSPDGLDKVAADHGLDANAADHPLGGSPLADYRSPGLSSTWGTIVSGLIGIAVVFVIAAGLMWLVRRRRLVA